MIKPADVSESRHMLERSQSPVVKALLQLIPGGIGSALDAFLTDGARMMQEERLRLFFSELERGGIQLTEELIGKQEFLHCFFSTTRAVVRTTRAEKIALFARALANTTSGQGASSVDEFEEAVSILDELSLREWQALVILDELLGSTEPDGNEMERAMSIWPAFLEQVERTLSVPRNEVIDF